jgi:tryptophanyl-tRNA synthetase
VTDSETSVHYDAANKPGISNLMQIYSACTGKSYDTIESEFTGQGYGAFKQSVGDAVVEMLRPIREMTEKILADKPYLESIYKQGAERASLTADKTLRKVYRKVGFIT